MRAWLAMTSCTDERRLAVLHFLLASKAPSDSVPVADPSEILRPQLTIYRTHLQGEIPEKSNGKDFFELPVFSYHEGEQPTLPVCRAINIEPHSNLCPI